MNRRMVLDNWTKFANRTYTHGAGTTQKFCFHIHQAMLNIENLFGRMFGEETLDSVCIYHGSKEGWNRLNLDNLPSSKSNPDYKSGCRCIKEGDNTFTSLGDIMTVKDYQHIMKSFKKLSDEELDILLLERDKDNCIRSKVNGLSLGPTLLEQCLCILQYYLRRFTSGYNVSSKNEFDRPNFQPLLFHVAKLMLSSDSDPYLWSLMEDGIFTLKEFAGVGETWSEVLNAPDPMFLIDEERLLIEDGKKKRTEATIKTRKVTRKRKAKTATVRSRTKKKR